MTALVPPVDIDSINATTPETISVAGSENGTVSGIQRLFVNNLRKSILATHDLVTALTYADFGTKDERVTSIVYTSAQFPAKVLTKTLTYSLAAGVYKLDTITWTVV